MKRFLFFLFVSVVFNFAFAQYNGSGYYRVQNKVTGRYIRVIDNKGSIDIATTNADLGALETKKGFENVVSDPASVIYITPAGDGYNFVAQGTSSYSIISYYVKLRNGSNGSYRAYAQHGGFTKYLCDENTTYSEGVVLTNGTKTQEWYIKPVNQADEQYFAFKPTVTVGNEYYTTIYAAFPFTLPAGMTAYYVSAVDGGQAVWKEVKDGKVPASTAVYVKCKSSNYADNKITIGDNGVGSLSGNLMKGVYFNNGTRKHNNQLAYNPKTMRVLGVMSDGKLGFVTANLDFIPANTAYLVVPESSPAELSLVSESEYKPVVPVQSVSLSNSSLEMFVGDSYTLTAEVLPANATDKSLKWSSSNSGVATVDANGTVKAVGYGKATVTATSNSDSAAKASCEVTVNAKCYTITYMVDGEVYETVTVEYGAPVVLIDEPVKEGHTFSGWSEAPETMPANDIVIKGSFTVNSYTITYKVDGEVYKTETVAYGAAIILIDEPTKDGYAFSGWSEAPETMPANDIVIEGTFVKNGYKVIYKVDGEVYKTVTVEYGAPLVLIDEPTKEGYTFSGWSEAPETMPAKDIIIEGTFTVNSYTVTYLVDGEVYATYTVEFGAAVPVPENPTKEGYIFEGWTSVLESMPAEDVVIEAIFSVDTGIIGVDYDKPQDVYSLGGVLIKRNATAEDIRQLPQGTYIIGGKKVYIRR